jgi:hypothetical protein
MQEAVAMDLRSLRVLFLVLSFVSLFVLFVPLAKLLRRTGHNPLWSLVAIFPGLNLIAFWFFAFKLWPVDKKLITTS